MQMGTKRKKRSWLATLTADKVDFKTKAKKRQKKYSTIPL